MKKECLCKIRSIYRTIGAFEQSLQKQFNLNINEAMLRMLDVRYMVTKDTGAAGGFAEKIRAARACGVTPIVIRRPVAEAMKEAEVDYKYQSIYEITYHCLIRLLDN